MAKTSRIWVLLAGIASLFIIFFTLKMPGSTYFWNEFENSGHAPLFGILSLFILEIMLVSSPRSAKKRWVYYLLAFFITAVFGAATEFIQRYTHGDPDIHDWIRDIAGAGAFLGLFAIYDSKRISAQSKIGPYKYIIIILAILIMLATFVPLALVSEAYIQRNQKFPTIMGFDSYWDRKFLVTQDVQLVSADPPPGWTNPPKGHVGMVTFMPSQYPGFANTEPYPDWSNREKLSANIFSEYDTTITLVLRIHDAHYDYSIEDCYNTEIKIAPGLNLITIPLADVEQGPKSRHMNMKRITNLAIFTVNPPKPITLYLGKFYLR
jgi:hypothetical protein